MYNEQLLTISNLCEMLNRKRCAVYRWEKEGKLPKAVKMGKRTLGWKATDIARWLEEQKQ